jgi:hypothetical protein
MEPEASPSKSTFKNPYLYSGIVILGVMAYVAFLLVSRFESNRAYDKRTSEKAAQEQRESDRAAVEQLGGTDLAIRAFYASPPNIRHGEKTQLCYDVANAKTVTIDPPADGEVWPSHNRCVDVTPKKTTTYTLTIVGASGNSTTQSVDVKVQ